jgi:hypothetical protein
MATAKMGTKWVPGKERVNLEEPIRLPSPHRINVSVRYGCIRVALIL